MKKYMLFLLGITFLLFLYVPVNAQHFTITAGTQVKVLSHTDLNTAGGINVAATGVLNIYGNVVADGSVSSSAASGIIVHSSLTGDGSFVFGSGSPKGTIYRYVTHGKWHQVSIPVTGATVHNFYFDENPRTWLARRDVTGGKWDYLTDLTQQLQVGEGFDYYIENDDETVSFTGTLTASDFDLTGSSAVPLVYANDTSYNLVGNPYAAPINIPNDGIHNWTFTHMEQSVWVWDGDAMNYKVETAGGNGNFSTIPMGQAFFVHVTGASPELTVPATRRVGSSSTYFKSTGVKAKRSHFILDVKEDSSSDNVWVTFGKNGTNGFDNGYDASKMFGSKKAPQLYIREDSVKDALSIDHLAPLNGEARVVQVSFVPGVDGKQVFIGHILNMDGTDVELEDLKTGIFHDFASDSIYTFNGTKKDNPNRFLLHIGKITGIDNPETGNGNMNIYAYNKAVYVHTKGTLPQGTSRIAIYDLMGRTVYNRTVQNATIIRIPIDLSHTYLIVRVVNGKNKIKISKVYLQ